MIKRKRIAFLICGVLIVITMFLCCYNFANRDSVQKQKDFRAHYNIYALNLPSKMQLAGETLDFTDTEIAERFDREMLVNVYWQSQTIMSLKKSTRWFPVIEPILKSQGVPDDFKYLALAESNFSTAVSPTGAAGFWQFMPATAREYQLIVNDEIDERYHVEKATVAACTFLKGAKAKFNSWLLAAAAYNMGAEAVAQALTVQRATNYCDLLLNEETSRYVFRIAAFKYIMSNPLNFGLHVRKYDCYPPYEYTTMSTDTSITDLAAFAISRGINYKKLKMLNPWLRKNSLTLTGTQPLELKILKSSYKSFMMYSDEDLKVDSL